MSLAMASPQLLHTDQPTRFLERGAAVPFTAPVLAGARVRLAGRGGVELLIPNPSGAAGVYVLPGTALRQFCRPTLHDLRLNDLLAACARLRPGDVRAASIKVAAEGLAGRAAQQAAKAQTDRDEAARMSANFILLQALVTQHDASGGNKMPLEQQARRVIARIAPGMGCAPEQIAASLEQLAACFAAVGAGPRADLARHSATLAQLATLEDTALAWRAAHDDASQSQAAMLAEAARLTIACGENIQHAARALLDDVAALLRAWQAAPARIGDTVERLDWVLDGWEPVALLWQAAPDETARRAALSEAALLVPFLPREAGDWVGQVLPADVTIRYRRSAQRTADRPAGDAIALPATRSPWWRATNNCGCWRHEEGGGMKRGTA